MSVFFSIKDIFLSQRLFMMSLCISLSGLILFIHLFILQEHSNLLYKEKDKITDVALSLGRLTVHSVNVSFVLI